MSDIHVRKRNHSVNVPVKNGDSFVDKDFLDINKTRSVTKCISLPAIDYRKCSNYSPVYKSEFKTDERNDSSDSDFNPRGSDIQYETKKEGIVHESNFKTPYYDKPSETRTPFVKSSSPTFLTEENNSSLHVETNADNNNNPNLNGNEVDMAFDNWAKFPDDEKESVANDSQLNGENFGQISEQSDSFTVESLSLIHI